MPLIDRLKSTGESYADFLSRTRGQEAKAKDYLPENAKIKKEVKMANAYEAALKDAKARSFAELSADTPHGLKELIALQNEGVKVVEYIRVGDPCTLCICEDAGVYWFDREVDE